MKKILSLLLCLSLVMLPMFAKADEIPAPVKLTKGVPYTPTEDGWYFTVKAEQQIRVKLLEVDYLKQAYTLLEENNEQLQFQLNFQQQISDKYRTAWLESDDNLTKALKRESRSKFLYFLGGVLLTIGAGVAVGYAAKAIR